MFIRSVRADSLKKIALLGVVLLFGVAVMVWPQAVASGISRGLSVCGSVLIPGLFPFLVLSGFLVRSGLCDSIGRRLHGVIQGLFYLPGCCAPVILIGMIGGYPAGGAAVADLYRNGNITDAQARRLLRFCVNAGPAFVISTVGAGLLGDVRAGLVLYAAHIGAALCIGIGDGLWERLRCRGAAVPPAVAPSAKAVPLLPALVGAVNATGKTLLSMSGFVLLCSAVLSLLDGAGVMAWLGEGSWLAALLPGLLEVVCGCVEAAEHPAAVLLLGTLLGFGGLSVQGQLAATLSGTGLLNRRFFAARLLQALLGGVLSVALYRVIPLPLPTFSPSAGTVSTELFFKDATTAAALMLMCGLFLLGTGKKAVASCRNM